MTKSELKNEWRNDAGTDRRANRPPDAALDPVDVRFLEIEDRARELVAERNWLRRELDRERTCESIAITAWKAEALAERSAKRRATYLAAALFIALVWREGWRIVLWLAGAA